MKKKLNVDNEVEEGDDDVDENVVDTLPKNQQVDAKKIMRVLRSRGDDLVSWTPEGM